MKKFFIALIVLFTLMCGGIVAFISIKGKNVPDMMAEAKAAIANGDDPAAEKILVKVLEIDPPNEEASTVLAESYERRLMFGNAAFYWRYCARLNPLKPSYLDNLYVAIAAAGMDEYYHVSYNKLPNKDKLSDKVKFITAYKYSQGLEPEILPVLRASLLDNKSSPYGNMLEAKDLLAKGDVDGAEKIFSNLVKMSDPDVRSYAQFGMMQCAAAKGATAEEIINLLNKIEGSDFNLKADVRYAKYLVYMSIGDTKNALEELRHAVKIRSANIFYRLECADLALMCSNAEVINEIMPPSSATDKTALNIYNYIKACEYGIKGNSKEGMGAILNAGALQKRRVGLTLMFKFACDTEDVEGVLKSAKELNEIQVPEKLRSVMESSIHALILKLVRNGDQISARKLAAALSKIAPNNILALRYELDASMYEDDAQKIARLSQAIEKQSPNDKQVLDVNMVRLFNKNKIDETLALALEELKATPDKPLPNFYAARCLAIKENKPEAVKHYMAALKTSKLTNAMSSEAVFYIFTSGSEEDFATMEAFAKESKDTEIKAEILMLRSNKDAKAKNYDAAIAQLNEAISLNPNYEVAYLNLSTCYYVLDKKSDAQRTIEKGLAALPSSSNLKMALILILQEIDPSKNRDRSTELLNSLLLADISKPLPYLGLAKVSILLNEKEKCIKLLKKVVFADPKNDHALSALAEISYDAGYYADAMQFALRVSSIKDNPRLIQIAEESLVKVAETLSKTPFKKKDEAGKLLLALPNNKVALKIIDDVNKEIENKKK